jgi:hypothetical protein
MKNASCRNKVISCLASNNMILAMSTLVKISRIPRELQTAQSEAIQGPLKIASLMLASGHSASR